MRPPYVTGYFYPDNANSLLDMIKRFLDECVHKDVDGKLRGLVVPHAGYVYSGIVAAAGYSILRSHMDEIDKIILLGPSHYALFDGAASSGEDVWETPLGMLQVHGLNGSVVKPFPQVHVQEHSLEVQIPFIQLTAPNASLYPVLIGNVSPKTLASDIDKHVDDRTVVVVSSDLSHYYPYDEAVRIDSKANQCIPKLDVECVEKYVEACGKMGILTLMHIALSRNWKCMFVDYKNSGDTSGDKSRVVGYGCYAFFS